MDQTVDIQQAQPPAAPAPQTSPLEKPPGPFARAGLAATLVRNYVYDFRRYWRFSFLLGARAQENLRGRIHMTAHFLEYGMSLRDPRKGFGLDRATRLADDVALYAERFGTDATTEIGLLTLEAYFAFNKDAGVDLAALEARVAALRARPPSGFAAGTETVTRDEILAHSKMDFLGFARARHSIRNYAPGPVPLAAIERAVAVAQQSPSSCNRQTCRVHVWTDPALVARVLALQSGNRGFGDQLGGVLVITSDLAHWQTPGERNQGYVDGGMFAMSLAYGLHAEGFGTVMLNWSEEFARDRALHHLARLPESALVITMMGVGNLPETLNVPVSQRKPLALAMTLNPPLA